MPVPARRSFLTGAATCLGAVVAGCAPPSSRGQADKDGRFAEPTEYVPEPLAVRDEVDKLARYVPDLHLVSGHYVGQTQQEAREVVPYPDRPTWVHLVAEVSAQDARELSAAATAEAGLLPPLYPALREYVPQGASFRRVGPQRADELLGVEKAQLEQSVTGLRTDELVVCQEHRLVILTGLVLRS